MEHSHGSAQGLDFGKEQPLLFLTRISDGAGGGHPTYPLGENKEISLKGSIRVPLI